MRRSSITIVGAGLAGALLAIFLARRGHDVRVFERRSDPRRAGYQGGRSINLALAERGMEGLRRAGLERAVLDQAVMMRGRMVHNLDSTTHFLPYGRDDSEVIWSVHRGRLNLTLLEAAERAGATIHFAQRLSGADLEAGSATFTDEPSGSVQTIEAPVLIGADGAGSALRAAMNAARALGEHLEPLGHGYKELEIPPLAHLGFHVAGSDVDAKARSSGFALAPNALHIWPRGGYMCIALPNSERTFTVTLFLPSEGDPSFATIDSATACLEFFQREFPDAVALIPHLTDDFTGNPTGVLATLRLQRWHHDGRVLLLGDAAHAMVPFHGQGMNCAFEDCVALDELLAAYDDSNEAFGAFEAARRPNADAIQDMALENYIEMRDLVDDPDFLLKKQVERALAERRPERFMPRYGMVMFTRMPYATAKARGAIQAQILSELSTGKSRFEQIDLARGEALITQRLPPLPHA
jgi:kynurenine 3-monooxygenase